MLDRYLDRDVEPQEDHDHEDFPMTWRTYGHAKSHLEALVEKINQSEIKEQDPLLFDSLMENLEELCHVMDVEFPD